MLCGALTTVLAPRFFQAALVRPFIVHLAVEASRDPNGAPVWVAVILYLVLGIVGLQYIWGVAIIRGVRGTDGWALATLVALLFEFCQRVALVQLEAFSGPYIFLLVVHSASCALRDAGLLSKPPSRLVLPWHRRPCCERHLR